MAALPKTFRKLMVQKLTTDFRAAVTIETVDMCRPKEGEICVKNKYVGVNATDVNVTKGRYFSGGKMPFDIGFEGVGEVVQIGDGVTSYKVGDAVAYLSHRQNAYGEYVCVSTQNAFKIPEAKPEYLVLMVSGLTSAIGLDKCAHIMNGDTVLITAAAGGAGHIAVQWAKAAECHVIATCSSKDKEEVLKNLGCDRVINYKTEDLAEVLSKEYPKGVDVIWETIGGNVFGTCVKNIAIKGRLIVLGFITRYAIEDRETIPKLDLSALPEWLLSRSASVIGYFLLHYQECFATYFEYLVDNLESGKIKAIYDMRKENPLFGLEGIIDGVEYLHTGKSIGKVIVKIS